MLDIHCLTNLVYIGTSLSIISRLCFGVVLWRNKSRNRISLMICCINVASNAFWMPYALDTNTTPVLIRSAADMVISILCGVFVAHNIWQDPHGIKSLSAGVS